MTELSTDLTKGCSTKASEEESSQLWRPSEKVRVWKTVAAKRSLRRQDKRIYQSWRRKVGSVKSYRNLKCGLWIILVYHKKLSNKCSIFNIRFHQIEVKFMLSVNSILSAFFFFFLQILGYSLIGLKATLSKREIMTCIGNPANYLGLMRIWILEDNTLLLLF